MIRVKDKSRKNVSSKMKNDLKISKKPELELDQSENYLVARAAAKWSGFRSYLRFLSQRGQYIGM